MAQSTGERQRTGVSFGRRYLSSLLGVPLVRRPGTSTIDAQSATVYEFPNPGVRQKRRRQWAMAAAAILVISITTVPIVLSQIDGSPSNRAGSPPAETSRRFTGTNPSVDEDLFKYTGVIMASVGVYESPYVDSDILYMLDTNDTVDILCTTRGDFVTDAESGVTSDLWAGIHGGFVPDVAVYTGTDRPMMPAC